MTDSNELLRQPSDSKPLCFINTSLKKEHCTLSPCDTEEMWLVVRSLKRDENNRGYSLEEGNVIKFGRLKFKVKELNFGDEKSILSNGSTDEGENLEGFSCDSDNMMCRICLSDISEDQNPMISPCNCAGTMRYIHVDCLQKWVSSRLTMKNSEHSVSYHWKAMDCELCKQTFPKVISVSDKRYELFTVKKPAGPYAVLEVITRDRSKSGIHVISFKNKSVITLGRGHECDVRISDISVSRFHALIRYQSNTFTLEDNDSKFGSLVQIQTSLRLDASKQFSVQVGRTVLTMALKKQSGNLAICSFLPNIISKQVREGTEAKSMFNRTLD